MHKTIFTVLVLLIFSIVSEMSVVHAFDMQEIGMWHGGSHMMKMADALSVFCEAWVGSEKNEHHSECLDSSAPDVIVPERIRIENEWKWEVALPIFWIDPSRHPIASSDRTCHILTLGVISKHGSSYADLVGIVKRLN